MKIRDILEVKGSQVYSVGPHRTVKEALALLVQFQVGALLVLDDEGHPVGIISERDVLRECHQVRGPLAQISVGEAMTHELLVGVPDDDLGYIMGIMTNNRVRHLPVVDGDAHRRPDLHRRRRQGVPRGDRYENRYLKEYIKAR